MSKKLVAYFSATGTTKKIAVNLAREEGADLFEITPEKPYTADDLDWRNKKSRSTVEMNDPNCHPPVISKVKDMGQYDEIILGFPIWWGREPSIVDTFLTQYDFSGKTIIPFCTSGGSSLGHATVERINNLLGRKATVVEGRRFGGEVSIKDMKTWLENL
ncbi:MAG: flavodoxin [Chordicoccus sp.]